MYNLAYSAQPQPSFEMSSQMLPTGPNNFSLVSHNDQHRQSFDGNGYIHNHSSYNPALADQTSLPPSGLLHAVHNHRGAARPHRPVLQTSNLTVCNDNTSESPYSGYQHACEGPYAQLQTPMTPTESSLYLNGSASDSMTSFSPSSNTSGELDPAGEVSPTVDYSPLGNLAQTEAGNNGAKTGGCGAERKKRNSRRMWTHSLEKYIFTPHEIATLGTPHRRTIYSASLEAHIDRLHSQLLGIDLYPVHVDDLHAYRGLNCKIAKSMVAGLQHDFVQVRTRLLEVERAMVNAREMAAMRANHEKLEMQSQGKSDAFGDQLVHDQSADTSLAPGAGPSLLVSEQK